MPRLVGGEGGNELPQWSQSRPCNHICITRKRLPGLSRLNGMGRELYSIQSYLIFIRIVLTEIGPQYMRATEKSGIRNRRCSRRRRAPFAIGPPADAAIAQSQDACCVAEKVWRCGRSNS
jgi:hypothetical protein